jgi:pimeloyl-ACP methyl ester carboxylesterase
MSQPDHFDDHYIQINGIRMHYVQAGGGERLLLLLHGFPEFWYSWRHQIARLSEHFTVVAPDLRGYNQTDAPSWGYELDVLVHDVVSLIRELGYTRAIVAGHDWGGAIAWATAIACPWRVERLIVLNAPHPALFLGAIGRNWRQTRRSWYMFFFQLPFLPEAMIRANDYAFIEQAFRGMAVDRSRFSDQDIARLKAAIARPGRITAAINYYRELFRQRGRGMFHGTSMLVSMPALLIWGEEDFALGKELTYGTERFAPDLRIRYLPRCSHWVQQECPEQVNQFILEFLHDLTS